MCNAVVRIRDIHRSEARFSKSMNRNYDQVNLEQKHAKGTEGCIWMGGN